MKTIKEIELNIFDLREEIGYNDRIISKIKEEQIDPLKQDIINARYKIQNIRETYGRDIEAYTKIHGFEPTHVFDNVDDYYGYKKSHDFCEVESSVYHSKGRVYIREA